jgi:hypothetical protein
VSVRDTNRKLTGRVRREEPEIILGYRINGTPGVTLSIDWETYGCYNNPEHILQMIVDLSRAYEHLMGTRERPTLS